MADLQPAYFLDTNILIYATSRAADHVSKAGAAREWVSRTDWGVSSQVLMEFYANARQARHGLSPAAAQQFVAEIIAARPVQAIDTTLVLEALQLAQRYPLSHWDAAILCAAQRLGAHTLISEDMGHGQQYGAVTVLNPFIL